MFTVDVKQQCNNNSSEISPRVIASISIIMQYAAVFQNKKKSNVRHLKLTTLFKSIYNDQDIKKNLSHFGILYVIRVGPRWAVGSTSD